MRTSDLEHNPTVLLNLLSCVSSCGLPPIITTHLSYAGCLTFTVAEGIQPNLRPRPYPAEAAFRKAIDIIFGSKWPNRVREWRFDEYVPPVPRVPVALHVCRESRAIALEHYSLAFAGTNSLSQDPDLTALFNSSGLGEKKIWVDWERDTIFVLKGDDFIVDMGGIDSGPNYLDVLARYAKDDTAKTQRLVIVGHWMIPNPRRSASDQNRKLSQTLIESLKLFTGLRELVIYHTDVAFDDFASITEEGYEGRRLAAIVKTEADEVQKEVVSDLTTARAKDKTWTNDLPRIRVSRDLQWWRAGDTRLEFFGHLSA